MTYEYALQAARNVLKDAGIKEYESDAWLLMEYVCRIDKSYYYLNLREEMEEECEQTYEVIIKKRSERVPLQYITGVQEFMGLSMKVNTNVLIPRQDTEILVEEALRVLIPGMRVLDLCTGSGCIIISLMKYAEGIKGVASDISKQALLVAKENAKINQVDPELIRSDLFTNITGTFDLIISNPPYIKTLDIDRLMPEVANFEPIAALDGREDGLHYYREIIAKSMEYLKPDGYLYFETGSTQTNAVADMMKQAGFREIREIKDLADLKRVVCGRRIYV